ncbi:hypothetical protein KAH81_00195 [bacterium]|nr:hypothetical protein [bacterium]
MINSTINRIDILNDALAKAPLGVCIIANDGTVMWTNNAFMYIHGFSEGISLVSHKISKNLKYLSDIIAPFIAREPGISWLCDEIKAVTINHTVFPAFLTLSKIYCTDSPITLVLLQDISNCSECYTLTEGYHKKIKELTAQIITASENERGIIARFIHDEISQLLLISGNKLHNLKKQELATASQEQIDDIITNLENASIKIRELSWELDLSLPLKTEFPIAISNLLDEIIIKEGLITSFVDDKVKKPIDSASQLVLFQATRELFFNIIKHASASEVDVTIEQSDNFIRVIVEDNGVGFEPLEIKPSKAGGLGLHSINERINNIGGKMKITSKFGKGTRIELFAPLNKKKRRSV